MRAAITNIFAMFTSNVSTIWQQLPGSPSPVFVSVVHVEPGIQFSLLSCGFPLCALPELTLWQNGVMKPDVNRTRTDLLIEQCIVVTVIFRFLLYKLAGVLTSEGPAF